MSAPPTEVPPSTPRNRRILIAVIGGLVVVAVAVGFALASRDDASEAGDASTTSSMSTSSPDTSTVAVGEWRAAVEQGCSEWNERYAHLPDARPGTAEQAIRHTRDVEALARGLDDVLSGAGLPTEDDLPAGGSNDARELVERTRDMATAASELATAAARADGPGVDRATERIERLGEQINPLADALGVPACGGY